MFSLLSFAMTSCQQSATRDTTLFSLRSTDHTQVTFSNTLIETDSLNMLTFTNFYTGSGVAIGDLNNDGLSDIFFGGNQVSSRLYINQRGLRFEDRTNSAGLVTDKWVTGVSLIDIDQDGFLDIYLSVSGPADREKNRNLLFINNGDLTFEESGKKYGLDDPSQSTHASFFDYDRDGDLDLFLAINPTDFALTLMGRAATRKVNGQAASTDKLFRNNGDGTFSDVSRVAGILYEGYSLGVNTSDFNNDGWVDIFISNDFATNDVLYINQHDGTFINQAADRLRHSSFASMGNDVADINNDGWQDLFVLDMYPEDNYREKMLVPTPNYNMFYYLLGLGYEPQYPRNVLQLNNGNGTFSEIGQMSGLSKTDWSWSALFADYDNDGLKDLYVTNGFTRDLGNLDFLNYNENSPFVNPNASPALHYQSIVNQDGTKIPNYAFMNKGDLTFEKVSSSWGLEKPSFSNGCAYGDLDGDGDLELVVSNINESAFIYENHSDQTGHHYLDLQLEGPDQNLHALGAKVKIRAGGKSQFHEHNIYRGYLSSVDQMIHFGLDTISVIDSIEVTWPDGSVTEFTDVKANQRHVISYKSGHSTPPINSVSDSDLPFAVFRDSALESYVHHDNPSRDFFIQPLIPHELSRAGPSMAVGDINGDGLEDIFIAGAGGYEGQLMIQERGGSFFRTPFPHDKHAEDLGSLLFDVDGDRDLDLYVVSGGTSLVNQELELQDRIYVNDGTGVFSKDASALPLISASGSCVTAADFDRDGDLDLFVGGRVVPGQYPLTPRSYLLKNDAGKFTDITYEMDSSLAQPGMVTSAIWTDFDNDSWIDLIVVGEWMPITTYRNIQGRLVWIRPGGLDHSNGWWNSIVSADFDKDGDMDYVLGNLGLNTSYRASEAKPFCIYAKDFDQNGSVDPIMCQYYDDTNFPVASRDGLIRQIPFIKRRFNSYDSYAKASFADIFPVEELQDALVLTSYTFESIYLENTDMHGFEMHPLPIECQVAPIFGMQVLDYDRDGNLDIMMVGNSYSTEVGMGRYDAFTGLVIKGNGKGAFEPVKSAASGIWVSGDAKSLAKVVLSDSRQLFLVSQNRGTLEAFELKSTSSLLELQQQDAYALITYRDGKTEKVETQNGSGYLSQSSRQMQVFPEEIKHLEIHNYKGEITRKEDFTEIQ